MSLPATSEETAKPGSSANREIEVKLLAGAGGLQAALEMPLLAGVAMQPRSRNLYTAYYDTATGDLQKAGVALRVRRVHGRYVMGVKFPPDPASGLFEREEVEVRLPSASPDIALFGPELAGRITALTGGKSVEAVFASNFRRRTGAIAAGLAHIELALDSGIMEAGDRSQPLEEIELELKQGDEADLCDFAASLAETAGLRLSTLSKGQRGSLLASGKKPPAARAVVPEYPPGMVVDDFIASVIGQCLAQFAGNWAAIEAGTGPEGVHQGRVALRRLRAMLGLFSKMLPAPEFRAFGAEAKQLASALGPAREWDVFLKMVHDGPLKMYRRDASFDALLVAANAFRDEAQAAARRTVSASAATAFVLRLRAFAARRSWRIALSGSELPILTGSARDFAARTLARMHKRILKRGRRLEKLSVEERHDLRIELKKIRYAAEFFGPLFDGAKARRQYA
ncbi:MAG: CHAD domain-containing protein, partial [Beijerinckiaceae bacterium]